MEIRQATAAYEHWLGGRMHLLHADLAAKHRLMAENPFSFLRATFYRWAQLWPDACDELARAPAVLAVGDLHVENFGTWRDAEGRLAWGINDFDEVTVLPYTQDLVRLAASALLAIEESDLRLSGRVACSKLLEGYREAMEAGGGQVVLAERYRWLRDLAVARLKDQHPFWDRLRARPAYGPGMDRHVRQLLLAALPQQGMKARFVHRQAGLGSLGRPRVVVLADWRGGMVAREAKALTTSAWQWARGRRTAPVRYAQMLRTALRVPDPFTAVRGEWLVRRLAPDCSRIELASLPRGHDEQRLLWMMGWETANIHLGSANQRRRILADLERRKPAWLYKSAQRMCEALERDWRRWRKRGPAA
ncbi:MAG: DUF2252 family protein [Proteobacteria bacterium]|nr:DUF2252 family protein [Pseudomonadota bacterium]